VVADAEAFAALLAERGLTPDTAFTDAQTLDVYHNWKVLNAILLDPVGNGRFRFDYLAEPAGSAPEGIRTGGFITAQGAVTIEQQVAAPEPMCPICLARGTEVDAPDGPLAVETIRIGDTVWTLDAAGARLPATVIAIGSTTAPAGHRVSHLVLADGRSVTASPGHPLADGRRLSDVRVGDLVDGSPVVTAESLPYASAETFDLAVSGPTGTYLVDSIPMGSTLEP